MCFRVERARYAVTSLFFLIEFFSEFLPKSIFFQDSDDDDDDYVQNRSYPAEFNLKKHVTRLKKENEKEFASRLTEEIWDPFESVSLNSVMQIDHCLKLNYFHARNLLM